MVRIDLATDSAVTDNTTDREFALSLAIGIMVGSLALPIIILGEQPRIPLHEAAVSIACGVAAACGCFLRARSQPERSVLRRYIVRIAIPVFLIFLLLVGSVALFGSDAVLTGLLLLAPLSWLVGWDAGRVVVLLDEPPGRDLRPVDAHRQLVGRFEVGAVILFVVAAISQLPLRISFQAPAPFPTGQFAIAFFGYVLVGLVLIADARYAWLSASLKERQAVIPGALHQVWALSAVGMVAVAATLYLVIPIIVLTGAFLPLFNQLERLLGTRRPYHFGAVKAPAGHCDVLKLCPGSTKKRLAAGHAHQPAVNVSLLSVDILIVVAVLAIVLYIFRRPLRARWFILTSWLRRLALRFLRRYGGSVFAPLLFRSRSPDAVPISPWKRLLPGLLSPRERVLHDYQQMLWRAEKQGVPRHIGQTPLEFGDILVPRLEGAGPDVHGMTAAFLEARFSLHPIDAAAAGAVHSAWTRVRVALRGLRRGSAS